MSAENTASPSPNNYNTSELIIAEAVSRNRYCVRQLIQEKECISQAACLAALLKVRFDAGRKLLICGNGGSAADAQHFSAELTIRYKLARKPLPAIALTTDTSALTAATNDFGENFAFERQLQALAQPGDVLVCLSTSGNSPNVCQAAYWAMQNDVFVVSLTGRDPESFLARTSDWCIRVPSIETARIQEMHQILYHGICEALDALYAQQNHDVGQRRDPDTGPRETATRERDLLVAGCTPGAAHAAGYGLRAGDSYKSVGNQPGRVYGGSPPAADQEAARPAVERRRRDD